MPKVCEEAEHEGTEAGELGILHTVAVLLCYPGGTAPLGRGGGSRCTCLSVGGCRIFLGHGTVAGAPPENLTGGRGGGGPGD